MADTDTLNDDAVHASRGKSLREARAYANLLGDGAEVARLTKEIERHEARGALTDEQRVQADALGAALVNARRELIHGGHICDDGDLPGVRLYVDNAVAIIDDATTAVQELLR